MKIWKPTNKLLNSLRNFYHYHNHAGYDDIWYIIFAMDYLKDMNPVDYLTWKDIQTIYDACQNVEIDKDGYSPQRFFNQALKMLKEDPDFKLKRSNF